mgnify:CR=1 FL=1
MTHILKHLSASAGAVLALTLAAASPAEATTTVYALHDHPDGSASPPYEYGLRMDSLSKFWSFENGASATLTYDDVGLTAKIEGTAVESTGNGNFGSLWDLEYTLSGIVDSGGGFFTATAGSGFIELGSTKHVLTGKQNDAGIAFLLVATHRLKPGDDADGAGAGWVQPAPGSTARPNDFLFTVKVMPVPAGVLLIASAFALAGAAQRVSKRREA